MHRRDFTRTVAAASLAAPLIHSKEAPTAETPEPSEIPPSVTIRIEVHYSDLDRIPTRVEGTEVIIPASVKILGPAQRFAEYNNDPRPLYLSRYAATPLRVTVLKNPGKYLGRPLATNDVVRWDRVELTVRGTAIPQYDGWVFDCDLIA